MFRIYHITWTLTILLIVCSSCEFQSRYTDRNVLKDITGVKLPENQILKDTLLGESVFLGDFERQCEIEFKELPSEEFYLLLDSICAIRNNVQDGGNSYKLHWNKVTEGSVITYNYYNIWGNSHPAPQGESDDEDRILSIHITKGERKAKINYGAW